MHEPQSAVAVPEEQRMNIVAITGIKQPEHALVAAEQGAAMIGLVFARSRRQVSTETAVRIAEAVGVVCDKPLLVGVFVNESLGRVLSMAREVGLGAVQLSGDESPQYVAECAELYPIIRAVRFPPAITHREASEMLDIYRQAVPGGSGRLRFLIDAYQPGEYGGTGKVADWPLTAALTSRFDIMLAGGLDPSNVVCAIAMVSPWGVDVSSGVESDGVKDPSLIREFLAAARQSARKDLL